MKTYIGYGLAVLVVVMAIIFLPWSRIWFYLCTAMAFLANACAAIGLFLWFISVFLRWGGVSSGFEMWVALIEGSIKRPGRLGIPLFLVGLILSLPFQSC